MGRRKNQRGGRRGRGGGRLMPRGANVGARAGRWLRSKVVGKAPVKIQPALETGPWSGEAERILEFPKD